MKRRRCSVNYKTTLSTQTLSDHTHYTHFTLRCTTFYILLTLEHQLKRQLCADNVYQIVPGHQHHRLSGHGHHYTKPICQSISRVTTSTFYIHHYTQRLLTIKVHLAPSPSHVLCFEIGGGTKYESSNPRSILMSFQHISMEKIIFRF